MQHRLKYSSNSIAHDLQTQAISDWQPLLDKNSDANIYFIHGGADKLIPVEGISQLVDSNKNYHLHTINEAGNWLYGRHTTQTFSIVRCILDKQPGYAD